MNSVERTVNTLPICRVSPPTTISAVVPGSNSSVCVRFPASSSIVVPCASRTFGPDVSMIVARGSYGTSTIVSTGTVSW